MILITAIALGCASATFAGDFKPGELLVKYKADYLRTRTQMNSLYESAGAKDIKHFGGVMQSYEHIVLKPGVRLEDAMARLRMSDAVEFVQPNYILYALPVKNNVATMDDEDPLPGMPGGAVPCIPGFDIPGCDPNAPLPCLAPGFPPNCSDDAVPGNPGNPGEPGEPGNPSQPPATRPELQPMPADVNPPVADPDLSKAWGIEKIQAPQAWEIHKGSKDFVVADIDTGIDYNHEDLGYNVWRNPNPTDKKDIVGYDFIHNDGLPFDDQSHGTHTAGTIGATGGNGKGVSGVAQRVSLMALKFLSAEGSGTTADAVRAIDYAIEHGAKVLSNSWGGSGTSGPSDPENKVLYDAIERARAKGVLFVAAAGNDGADNDKGGQSASYPAAFDNDNLISVAATDKSDALPFFSNYGKKTTHLAAPGVNVYSSEPGNKYKQESGTSMACPHVAGAAAVLWSMHPDWDYKKVKKVLMDTTDKVPGLANKVASGGRLNLANALRSKE